MCGIVAGIADRPITPILLEGLKRLEYRGYDSAGIAVIEDNVIFRSRTLGKVSGLVQNLQDKKLKAHTGIAHTRWATHGKPSECNAHPHMSGEEIALVHNGIIENHVKLRKELIDAGYTLQSETDTEVVVHMIHHAQKKGLTFLEAVKSVVSQLEGAFSFAILSLKEPHRVIGVKKGSPLVVGIGINERFIASDSLALAPVADEFIYLEEGDIVEITQHTVDIYDYTGKKVERPAKTIRFSDEVANKGEFRHFMLKEIFEQPEAINGTLEGRISGRRVFDEIFGESAKAVFDKIKNVQIVACGTSYHAALVAKYWIEEMCNMDCRVEVASEYRYRHTVVPDNCLFVTISQSGETADTLAALRKAKHSGYLSSLVICNVPESSLVRESDLVFMTRAGMEIGVASTKAFTTQLTALLMLSTVLAKRRGLTLEKEQHIAHLLSSLPLLIAQTLELNKGIEEISHYLADKQHALFLGRGMSYPIAMEGALKLKEISYIHAEAYPAGELKHGPLALVDKDMPVIAVAPNDELLEKLCSNLHEVRARGGELILFSEKSAPIPSNEAIRIFQVPKVEALIAPIIYTIPLQLLAYHVAVIKGTDVDQPRNLAKSVTVE